MRLIVTVVIVMFQMIVSAQPTDKLLDDLNNLYVKSYENIKPTQPDFEEIKTNLHYLKDKYPQILTEDKIGKLITATDEFYNFSLENDSLLSKVYPYYLLLTNELSPVLVPEFNTSPKKKIVIVVTSMSCKCTIEMCEKQLYEVIQFAKANRDTYKLFIENAWESEYFKGKYGVGFVPTVLRFNESNEITKQYIREENLKLSD